MMKLVKSLLAVAVATACFSPLASEVAGKTMIAKGKVNALSDQQDARKLKRRSPVYGTDKVTTGSKSKAQLRMKDGGMISVKENSELVITDYRYSDENGRGNIAMELVKGGLRSITGSIKSENGDYNLKTPVGSIGIRGTHFEVEIVEGDMFLAVWDGAIDLTVDTGGTDSVVSFGEGEDFSFGIVTEEGEVTQLLEAPENFDDGHSDEEGEGESDDESSDEEESTEETSDESESENEESDGSDESEEDNEESADDSESEDNSEEESTDSGSEEESSEENAEGSEEANQDENTDTEESANEDSGDNSADSDNSQSETSDEQTDAGEQDGADTSPSDTPASSPDSGDSSPQETGGDSGAEPGNTPDIPEPTPEDTSIAATPDEPEIEVEVTETVDSVTTQENTNFAANDQEGFVDTFEADESFIATQEIDSIDITSAVELLAERSGSLSFSGVEASNIESTSGPVTDFTMSMSIDLDKGTVPLGQGSFVDDGGEWFFVFNGLITNAELDLDITFASHGDNLADGDIEAEFFDGIDFLNGKFELWEIDNTTIRSSGSFKLRR